MFFLSTNIVDRAQTLTLLREHMPTIVSEFDVQSLALFGSMVRGQARDNSDIDILVTFIGTANSSNYFGLQFYLEDLLERPVDLVTDRALRPELRPYIEREALRV